MDPGHGQKCRREVTDCYEADSQTDVVLAQRVDVWVVEDEGAVGPNADSGMMNHVLGVALEKC